METTTTQSAPIFRCSSCEYSTNDSHTAEVINDMTGVCPKCNADAQPIQYGGFGEWSIEDVRPCNHCGTPVGWDESILDYRHIAIPDEGCFLASRHEVR